MRGIVIGIVCAFAAGHAVADGCVVGTEVTNVRPDGTRAVSSVFSVAIYPDVKSCNDALSYQAKNLPLTSAAKAYPWDSLTFDCHVPETCHPNDVETVQPFSRVVYVSQARGPRANGRS
jgi:hypothetical protein